MSTTAFLLELRSSYCVYQFSIALFAALWRRLFSHLRLVACLLSRSQHSFSFAQVEEEQPIPNPSAPNSRNHVT